ncbi:endonuclease/exonuclease/phosphatase family protein [Caulobacter sp. LARHSG274]
MRLIRHLLSLLLRGTALLLGLVGAVIALACLGGAFSDQLDALTHLTPVWFALGLASLALGLVFADRAELGAVLVLSAMTIVITGGLMAPEIVAAVRAPRAPATSATLKLVQFNIWADNRDPEATLDWILAQKADVVLIEEGGSQAWPIVKRLRQVYPDTVTCAGQRGCDTWIFSRWPMIRQHGLREDGLPLTAAWATLRHPDGDFTVAVSHHLWPVPAGPQQAQSRLLAAELAPFDKRTLILGGDFNSTPWSFSLRRQDAALGLVRRTRALASWPAGRFTRLASAPFPILPIDQVYAGRAWKTVSVERGPVLGSDHRPVVVTLTR